MLIWRILSTLVLFSGAASESFVDKDLEEITTLNFLSRIQELLETKPYNVPSQCVKHLQEYIHGLGIGKIWAMKMFDARGKIPSGLLDGNSVDLGFFDECLMVEGGTAESEKIFGKYCIGTIAFNVNFGKINNQTQSKLTPKTFDHVTLDADLAICVPDVCSAENMQEIYAKIIGPGVFTLKEELCQTKSTISKLDGGAIATVLFLGGIFGLMLISTAYDVAARCLFNKPIHPLLTAFSVYTNGKTLLAINSDSNQINCLDGIRVLSTVWIIVVHRYTIKTFVPNRNLFAVNSLFNKAWYMLTKGNQMAVDSFLLMSGLVVAYVYMCSTQKRKNFNIILFYLHRYVRLTPVVAVIVLIHLTLLKHLGSGPLWPKLTKDWLIKGCEKNWEKALTYTQNYEKANLMCILQSWYLSVDMQLFLLSPLLLLPLRSWPKVTILATTILTACSIMSCFLSSWFLEFSVSPLMASHENFSKYYYHPTWTRAAPWLIGFILGYLIFKVKQRKTKLPINKTIVLLLWATALIILFTCVFAGHNLYVGKYNKVETSFYVSLVRPSWAVALGWVIFACVNGHGGPVDRFLSAPIFQIFSKLTYTLYMTHFTVMFMMTAQMRTTSVFSYSQVMYEFWGDFAFSSAAALVLKLAFELPVVTIEKAFLEKAKYE